MAYGSALMQLGNSARGRGLAAYEAGNSALMSASSQAAQQAFARREAERQRQWQEEQQKKAEKAAKKKMWTNLGISAGTGAVGGAITGGLAALPVAGAAGGAGAAAVPMGGAAAAMAPAATGVAALPAFAGGNPGLGALAGAGLGALSGVGGGDYLTPAINLPFQRASAIANLSNTANNTALNWAKFGLDQREAENLNDYRGRMAAAREAQVSKKPSALLAISELPEDMQQSALETYLKVRPNANTTATIGSREKEGAANRTSREGIADANRVSRELSGLNTLAERARQFDEAKPIRQQNANSQTSMAETRAKNQSTRGPAGKSYYTDDEVLDAYKGLNDFMADPRLSDPTAGDARHAAMEDFKKRHFQYMTPSQQSAILRKMQQRWAYSPRVNTTGL